MVDEIARDWMPNRRAEWSDEQMRELRARVMRAILDEESAPRHWTDADDFDPRNPRPALRRALMRWGLGWPEAYALIDLHKTRTEIALATAEFIATTFAPDLLEWEGS